MRMRRKPWARPELAACPFFIDHPLENRGNWHACFPRRQPIHLELGCGKGHFMAGLAAKHPEINYMAVDIKSEVLAVGRRLIAAAYEEEGREVDNLLLMSQDIARIEQMMAPEDMMDRIYINFCNPWPKPAHWKRRLTHPRQLQQYKTFLRAGGELHFKTDDLQLYRATQGYLQESGFSITYQTEDLHRSGYESNVQTEHERMFAAQGIPIKFLIARYGKSMNE